MYYVFVYVYFLQQLFFYALLTLAHWDLAPMMAVAVLYCEKKSMVV